MSRAWARDLSRRHAAQALRGAARGRARVRMADYLGVRARTVFLPQPVLAGLASAADVVSKVTGRHLPLNRKLARQLLAPAWTCSTEKARRLLDFTAATPLQSSIERSAAWYRDQGWI